MQKIIVITTTFSQPRIIKRISSFHKNGFKIKVYGYARDEYQCNSFPSNIECEILGSMKSGSQHIKKISRLRKDIKDIIKKEGNDVLYYSFDLFSAWILKTRGAKYCYELSDLFFGYKRYKPLIPFFKSLTKNVINHSFRTIMTSEGFQKYLFKSCSPSHVIIQPNKLNSIFNSSERPLNYDIDIRHLRFAFIGAIRYRNTILRFAKIIGRLYPQHEFHFYGESIYVNDFISETKDYKNIIYHGRFKNPEDLTTIYNNIDIVVACYETENLNERVAEPNKLYEAIFFNKPIIVSRGSFLGEQVEKFKCGFAINSYTDEEIISFLNNLSYADINTIIDNENKIDKKDLIDNPDPIIYALRT